MGQLSSIDTTETQADDEVVVEVDERRQAVLDELTARLGDAVVGSHIRPGNEDDFTVRNTSGSTSGAPPSTPLPW